MADKNSGDKTEKPTAHALKEARKRGDVPKSRDIGLTLGFIFTLFVLWLSFGFVTEKLASLMTLALESSGKPFFNTLLLLGREALMVLLLICAIVMIPVALFSLLVEFLQTGPIMTVEKMLPNMGNLNPVEGVKRMFSMDNLFDLTKSIIQTLILALVAGWVLLASMDELAVLPFSNPLAIIEATAFLIFRVFGWTCVAFIFLMFIDATYQHQSFVKKMRMSRRDIKQELKDTEGDPLIKGTRRQLAKEWSEENATKAARKANVLVVNPTHVAVALIYEPEQQKVPVISARAEDDIALAMRSAAESAGIPILRNEQLARALLASDTEDNVVPRELFNIVAEVILWAQSVSRRLEEPDAAPAQADTSSVRASVPEPNRPPPGEDLTHYPPDRLHGFAL